MFRLTMIDYQSNMTYEQLQRSTITITPEVLESLIADGDWMPGDTLEYAE